MKDTCVVHLTPVAGSMQASARVARFIAETFGVPLVDSLETLKQFVVACGENVGEGRRHTVIMVNGPIAFCGFRDELGTMLLPYTQNLFWVQQDYTISLPPHHSYSRPTKAETPFRREFFYIPHVALWSTCEDWLSKRVAGASADWRNDRYVNWNALTYAPMAAEVGAHIDSVFYYGAFREDRRLAFRRFFRDATPEQLAISVSNMRPAAMEKWYDCATAHFIPAPPHAPGFIYPPLNGNRYGDSPIIPLIGRYKHSLYIADQHSDSGLHSLANRFYEVLSTPDTVLWLDAAGEATYKRAGLHGYQAVMVSNWKELQRNMRMSERERAKIANQQRSAWIANDPYKLLCARLLKDLKRGVA